MRLVPGANAPDVVLTGMDGKPVSLSLFWAKGPVVIAFLRQLG